jgi:hypothetical protein
MSNSSTGFGLDDQYDKINKEEGNKIRIADYMLPIALGGVSVVAAVYGAVFLAGIIPVASTLAIVFGSILITAATVGSVVAVGDVIIEKCMHRKEEETNELLMGDIENQTKTNAL